MHVTPADAIEQIRRLNHRYAELVDHGRLREFAQMFSRATWRGFTGSDDLLAYLHENVIIYPDGTPRTHHLVSNLDITLTGDDRAESTSVITIYQARWSSGEIRVITVNDYRDTYRLESGVWRFESRWVVRRLEGDMSEHLRSENPPEPRADPVRDLRLPRPVATD